MPTSSLAPQRSYLWGCGLIVLSGLILSLGVLCIRGAGSSDAFQYLFWRAIGFSVAVGILASRRHAIGPMAQVRRMGGFAWLSAIAMVVSQVGFIAAVKLTTVAEVFFLLSLAPLMAAAIALPLLGERIGLLGAAAIALALGGVALMTGADLGGVAPASSWYGRLMALTGALAFAYYSLATRGAQARDLDAALVATGLLTALVSFVAVYGRGLPLFVGLHDTMLAILHGGVILAVGLVLIARGSRVVPGVTLIMLAQSESIAAPIWTYIFFNETTRLAVISGGALILLAVVLQAADGAIQSAASRGDHRN